MGGNGDSGHSNSVEIYDPALNTWSAAAPLTNGRYSHTSTLLSNGKVLVIGVIGSTGTLRSAEIYDPVEISGVRQPLFYSRAGALSLKKPPRSPSSLL